MNKVYCYCYHPCTTIVPFLSAEKASSCTFGILTELLGKTAISTRSLGFKTLPIDIFSGTLRAVVNQCMEFASVVDWYCSCRLLCHAPSCRKPVLGVCFSGRLVLFLSLTVSSLLCRPFRTRIGRERSSRFTLT